VEYLGQLDRPAVAAAVAAASVVVAAPLWQDVLPTAVIEALAAGRPVLGTEMGGVPYLIGDAGWTVPPTAEALAAALPTARAGAAALSSAARLRYERTFHPDVVTKKLLDVYAGVR
jgi:glycosyltransferase involved in cell wall biosynthesis